jgi:hypothetical protein
VLVDSGRRVLDERIPDIVHRALYVRVWVKSELVLVCLPVYKVIIVRSDREHTDTDRALDKA